jgi:hypothetical protein
LEVAVQVYGDEGEQNWCICKDVGVDEEAKKKLLYRLMMMMPDDLASV